MKMDNIIHDELLNLITDGISEGVRLNETKFDNSYSIYEMIIENQVIFVSPDSIGYNGSEYYPDINVLYSRLELEFHGDKMVVVTTELNEILGSFK